MHFKWAVGCPVLYSRFFSDFLPQRLAWSILGLFQVGGLFPRAVRLTLFWCVALCHSVDFFLWTFLPCRLARSYLQLVHFKLAVWCPLPFSTFFLDVQ